jgi:hypothetical protein
MKLLKILNYLMPITLAIGGILCYLLLQEPEYKAMGVLLFLISIKALIIVTD